MKFQLTAQQKTLEKGLEILLNAKGHQLAGDGICILPEPHTEKTLTVSWDGSSAVIGYCHTTHFFRGVGLLLQHLSEGSFFLHGNGMAGRKRADAGLLQKRRL